LFFSLDYFSRFSYHLISFFKAKCLIMNPFTVAIL
jgi:hypothetical protein